MKKIGEKKNMRNAKSFMGGGYNSKKELKLQKYQERNTKKQELLSLQLLVFY